MIRCNKNTFFGNAPLAVLLTLIFASSVYAQREPQYTQYMYNIGSFNPAYVGTVENLNLTGLYRAQWIDIPGAPRNIRFGINIPFANERHGMGFNVVNDEIGPTTNTYVDVAYSYQVRLSDETKLSFGVDVGGSFVNVDFSKGTFENPGEPVLGAAQIKEFYPTVGAGLFLYQEDWYLGASVPNFLTDGLYDETVAIIVEDKIQFNFIGGYVFNLSDNLKFKPAFLLNYIDGAPTTFNISTNFLIKDTFTIGAAYRIDNSISGLAGFQISNGTFIGYSYDYNTNGLGEYNSGSHEVILKFYLGRGEGRSKKDKSKTPKDKPKQIDSPRFF
ncbi:MAG: PorP/SprF family type IX secretion system membrane protein [Flavobacteriaceae bacterium]